MGLLDSVLGSVLGGQQAADVGPGGGLAGMLGTLLSNPQPLQVWSRACWPTVAPSEAWAA